MEIVGSDNDRKTDRPSRLAWTETHMWWKSNAKLHQIRILSDLLDSQCIRNSGCQCHNVPNANLNF